MFLHHFILPLQCDGLSYLLWLTYDWIAFVEAYTTPPFFFEEEHIHTVQANTKENRYNYPQMHVCMHSFSLTHTYNQPLLLRIYLCIQLFIPLINNLNPSLSLCWPPLVVVVPPRSLPPPSLYMRYECLSVYMPLMLSSVTYASPPPPVCSLFHISTRVSPSVSCYSFSFLLLLWGIALTKPQSTSLSPPSLVPAPSHRVSPSSHRTSTLYNCFSCSSA